MNDTTFQGDGKVAYVPVMVNAKPKPMTNADLIRAMTDEELAEFLNCHNFCARNFDCENGKQPCIECNLEWLKQEADE